MSRGHPQRWHDMPFILESDCATVVTKLEAKSLVRPLIQEALMEGSNLRQLKIRKINREQNRTAHELAHSAIRSSLFFS